MTAADKILRKALVGSPIDSAAWSKIQAGLRDRAFFSATVEDMRILHAMRQGVADILNGGRSQSEVRRDLRAFFQEAGYAPADGKAGTMKDLYSQRRLDVMLKTNCDQARGYVSHLRATSAGAILAFPAYELVRVEKRQMPRDWRSRWLAAANNVHWQGVSKDTSRMIALKTSPVWAALSAFGNPYPPFDFNSGMGVRDIPKSKCRELGLLGPDEQPKVPPAPNFNQNLTYTAPIHDNSMCADIFRDIFRDRFCDQVRFDGNRFHFVSELMRDVFNGKVKKASLGVGFNGKKTSISRELVSQHIVKHVGENETYGGNVPLTENDFELLPTLWRNPDRVVKGHSGKTIIELDVVDKNTIVAAWDELQGFHTIYKTKNPLGAE